MGRTTTGTRRGDRDMATLGRSPGELHVLSEYGDPAATTRWMVTDPDARQVWNEVERLRDQLRTPPGRNRRVLTPPAALEPPNPEPGGTPAPCAPGIVE